MGHCTHSIEAEAATTDRRQVDEVLLASRDIGKGIRQTDLAIPAIHCGGCVQRIERALGTLPGVVQARVNLSTKRAAVQWRTDDMPPAFISALNRIGFEAHLYDAGTDEKDGDLAELLRALAVAGFAASNIMMLSVAVWSGADPDTRDLLHWISALVALPAVAYSGRIFFRSAWRSLRHGQTNMDVPISVGVFLAAGLSLYETVHHGQYAYFDASISLLFFLLVGRTLDHVMRERARTAVQGLARHAARGALVLRRDGTRAYLPVNEIEPGMTILLAAGERVPVDARVLKGESELDCSLVSGESLPQPASATSLLQAGTLNLTGPLTIVATAPAKESFLAEMVRMMEAAESGRSAYRRIADRAARLYAPVVHLTALFAFVGWMIAVGDVHRALTIAIAVLIITCPCALGLAVPMVHVVAAQRLFDLGIMVKDGSALERLAKVDTVVFDKTGTLTVGDPRLVDCEGIETGTLALAAAIASHSRHPYSRALASAGSRFSIAPISLNNVSEHAGLGLEASTGGAMYRLGRPEWALERGEPRLTGTQNSDVALSKDGRCIATFCFVDRVRSDAAEAVTALLRDGFAIEVLSGDREEPVRKLASALGVPYVSSVPPSGKVAYISALASPGRKVLMVGDGLNDAPALVAAHASMAPATAADVGRNAADLVFLRESLLAVPQAISISREAQRLIRQNFTLAVCYNVLAVPIAVLGYVTPLIAAVAMSASSLIVVANAVRLQGAQRTGSSTATAFGMRLLSPRSSQ